MFEKKKFIYLGLNHLLQMSLVSFTYNLIHYNNIKT